MFRVALKTKILSWIEQYGGSLDIEGEHLIYKIKDIELMFFDLGTLVKTKMLGTDELYYSEYEIVDGILFSEDLDKIVKLISMFSSKKEFLTWSPVLWNVVWKKL